jgi:hypothetical protein
LPLVVNFAPQYEAIGAAAGAPFSAVNNELVAAAAAALSKAVFVEADE